MLTIRLHVKVPVLDVGSNKDFKGFIFPYFTQDNVPDRAVIHVVCRMLAFPVLDVAEQPEPVGRPCVAELQCHQSVKDLI